MLAIQDITPRSHMNIMKVHANDTTRSYIHHIHLDAAAQNTQKKKKKSKSEQTDMHIISQFIQIFTEFNNCMSIYCQRCPRRHLS